VLLRLAYLGVTNAFAMLRLLPMSDRDKDAEILALRHQITVLERQLGKDRVRFDATDRRSWRRCTGCRWTCSVGCDCWCVRTRSFAGTGTWSHTATLPSPGRSAQGDRARSTPSGSWCCA
jgi:hypothetical protein